MTARVMVTGRHWSVLVRIRTYFFRRMSKCRLIIPANPWCDRPGPQQLR